MEFWSLTVVPAAQGVKDPVFEIKVPPGHTTETRKVQLAVFELVSVAVHVTCVLPIGNVSPEVREQATDDTPTLSVDVGPGKNTVAVELPAGVAVVIILGGQIMTGAAPSGVVVEVVVVVVVVVVVEVVVVVVEVVVDAGEICG